MTRREKWACVGFVAGFVLFAAVVLSNAQQTYGPSFVVPGSGGTGGSGTATNIGSSTNASAAVAMTNLAWGATLFVDSVFGNNATGLRGDASKPFLTISQANVSATSGDTIWVRNGTYDHGSNQLVLKHGVSLIGQSKYGVIIKGSFDGAGGVVLNPGSHSVIASLTVNSRGDPNWTRISMGAMADPGCQAFTNTVIRDVILDSDTDTWSIAHIAAPCSADLIDVDHNRPGQTGWDGIRQSGNNHSVRFFNNRVHMDHLGSSNTLNDLPGMLGYANGVRITQGYMLLSGCHVTTTNADSQGYALALEDAGVTCRVDVVSTVLEAAGTNNIARIFVTNPTNNFVRLAGTRGNTSIATLTSGRYQCSTADDLVGIPNGSARTNDLPDTRWLWEGREITVWDAGNSAAGTNIFIRPYFNSGQKFENAANVGSVITNIGANASRLTFRVRGTNWIIVGSYP